ncbi:glutamine--fructose-6-phosphate aminotransferase [isomerizing] [Alphaproteobacteria bacterium]|nr:glutamine--fructose-6-phosphate aminotransferase [isomerizing] [Alphaproteobacteria bacterium]
MCGIVGVIGAKSPVNIIIDGLKKLEYRGYDSAGVALVDNKGFKIVKEEGKIIKLENKLKPLLKKLNNCEIAIGHTRWATHGKPSKENAHPHASKKVCVVHNGIIENYQKLKNTFQNSAIKFISETDTEALPHLFEKQLEKTKDLKKALITGCSQIHGTFALAVIFNDYPDVIAVAKRGSPLVIGIGQNQNFVASDFYALANYTHEIIILDDEEFALVYKDKVEIFNKEGQKIVKQSKTMESQNSKVGKDGFAHFMLKEIYEQPRVLEETIQGYLNMTDSSIHLPNFNFDLKKINKITIVACGTSYYAGLAGKYIIEDIAGIEVEVDIASEFRYRSHPFRDDNLMIFVSQSGETADTLASLKYAKQHNQKILSIVNVAHSSMAQLSDAVIRTLAGPEIGVASTKAYTAQIAVLSILAIHIANIKQKISAKEQVNLIKDLSQVAINMANLLDDCEVKNIKKIAYYLAKQKQVLYIGRSICHVSALEASLKFRELTYLNAQGISAGELKHGTIAVIDKKMPVIVIAVHDSRSDLLEKTLSNAQEVNARGGKIIFVSSNKGINQFNKNAKYKIEVPQVNGIIQEALMPIIPMQLLAYYVALFKNHDVDQPRNLAKSVTVE